MFYKTLLTAKFLIFRPCQNYISWQLRHVPIFSGFHSSTPMDYVVRNAWHLFKEHFFKGTATNPLPCRTCLPAITCAKMTNFVKAWTFTGREVCASWTTERVLRLYHWILFWDEMHFTWTIHFEVSWNFRTFITYFCKLGAELRFNLFLSIYLKRELDPDLKRIEALHSTCKQANKQTNK